MNPAQYPVHKSHCCVRHGCKYGDEDCPVVCGKIKQLYGCESCDIQEEENSELEELRLYKSEHERLKGELNKILHPNNDGPANPSFCDLVSCVEGCLSKLRRSDSRIENVQLEAQNAELIKQNVDLKLREGRAIYLLLALKNEVVQGSISQDLRVNPYSIPAVKAIEKHFGE